jgi:hypothetical protein
MSDDTEEIVVVCAKIEGPLLLSDNLVGRCFECRRRVQYRPHAPEGRKLCFECAVPHMLDGAEIGTTDRMIEDYQNFLRRKLQ